LLSSPVAVRKTAIAEYSGIDRKAVPRFKVSDNQKKQKKSIFWYRSEGCSKV